MATIRLHAGLLAITIAFLGPAVPVRAQDGPEQQLTGGSLREWVFRRIVRSMGSGDVCASGLTYTFEKTGRTLAIRECKGGKLDTSRYTWHLANDGAGDAALVVDRMGTFLLLFRDAPDGGHFMRLRTQGRVPTQPTEDKEFRLNED